MNAEVVAFASADEEVRALLASLPFDTVILHQGASPAGAYAALVRGNDADAIAHCRASGIPALAFGGADEDGVHAVGSRAEVCSWVRALAGGTAPSADPGPLPPPIDEQRAALAAAPPRAIHPLRIVHIGTYAFGETDVVHRILTALRTLGHEVVAIDPRAIEGLARIERLDGVVPIGIDVERLVPLLDRFDPDVVVWDAGGFHPSIENAQLLRERRIAQLHLVLSDPDAHETALTFADRFDAVATNAHGCVETYQRLGIPLVRHLPFAVDHAFAVMPVPPRPDWRADVVCVGHGRPDRQETMKLLAQRFEVRVYGRNWELPAVEARDQDVAIALREGTFHVNFPRTKAGFTNVKVGVFESIAQGGVLCTGLFEEMSTLFEFDREIVGYRDDEQLAAAIAWLRDHPREIDEIRRRAFARLVRDHLWERRLDGLLEAMDLRPKQQRSSKVVVIGEQITAAAAAVDRARAGSIVRAVTTSPARALLDEGIPAIGADDLFESEDAIREADAVIFTGPVDDQSFRFGGGIPDVLDGGGHGLAAWARSLLLAHIHDVPVIWHDVAAGPLDTSDGKTLTTVLARVAISVSARDEASARALASCGIGAKVGTPLELPPTRTTSTRRTQVYPRRISSREQLIADLRRQLTARARRIKELRDHVKELRGIAAQAQRRAPSARGGGLAGRIRRSVGRRLGQ